ncbi:MAG: hypothetical protein ACYTF6_13445, partial [Planctomycetota bacterium]
MSNLQTKNGNRKHFFSASSRSAVKKYWRVAILPADLDYVRHWSFSSPTAERQLWGPNRRRIDVPMYELLPE